MDSFQDSKQSFAPPSEPEENMFLIQFKAQSMDWMSVSRKNISELKIVSRVFMLYKIQPRGIIKIKNDETQQDKIHRWPQLVLKQAII